MKIGEVAHITGITIDTIRYYEREGLVKPAYRAPSGYRYYDDKAIQQLNFIIKSKSLGFSLQEIGELLGLRVEREKHPCSDVKEVAQAKLLQIEQKIEELTRMHHALKRISDSCCGGPESAVHCSILEALEHA
jgi:MerR family Zn(II)-responsive transcriptional regulator of zntA